MNVIDEKVVDLLKLLNDKLHGNVDYSLFSEIFDEVASIGIPSDFVIVRKTMPDSVVEALENSSYHWGENTKEYFAPIYDLMIEVQMEK